MTRCERCGRRALATLDEPEQDSALLFGDEPQGLLLCGRCLALSEADGDWHAVYRLDAA